MYLPNELVGVVSLLKFAKVFTSTGCPNASRTSWMISSSSIIGIPQARVTKQMKVIAQIFIKKKYLKAKFLIQNTQNDWNSPFLCNLYHFSCKLGSILGIEWNDLFL